MLEAIASKFQDNLEEILWIFTGPWSVTLEQIQGSCSCSQYGCKSVETYFQISWEFWRLAALLYSWLKDDEM